MFFLRVCGCVCLRIFPIVGFTKIEALLQKSLLLFSGREGSILDKFSLIWQPRPRSVAYQFGFDSMTILI